MNLIANIIRRLKYGLFSPRRSHSSGDVNHAGWSPAAKVGQRQGFFGSVGMGSEQASRIRGTTLFLACLLHVFTAAYGTHALAVDQEVEQEEGEISFNADIRPILSDNCFSCHGPDEHGREADLRLDVRDDAVDFGAITPGDPDDSLILDRILETDPDLVMPPPKSGKTILPEQRKLLKRWIQAGAKYEQHWSFVPIPKHIPLPKNSGDDEWSRHELDRFVMHRLRQEGVDPAVEADRGAWLRRVSYDLTGLPPSPELLHRFLQDESVESYEKVVDELLASEAYGEHMATMWLDVARYADTYGYQNDVEMEVWPWRDWVIQAFNENLPYNKFVQNQIAGDLLPNPSVDQKLATTFNRLHRQTNEGGSVVEEFRQANIADRTVTAGTAFMGLTMECCRCHDHKYDPLLRRDFYSLAAYFSNIDELGLYAHFTRGVPTPALSLYEGEQESNHREALATIGQLEQQLLTLQQQRAASFSEDSSVSESEQGESGKTSSTKVVASGERLLPPPKADFEFPLEGTHAGVLAKATLCDGDKEVPCKDVPELSRNDPFTFTLWVRPAVSQPRMLVLHQSVAAEDSAFRGLQLTLDDGRPEISLIHFWPGNAVRVEALDSIPTGQWSQLSVRHDGSGKAAGLRLFVNGSAVATSVERDQLTRDIRHRKEWGDLKVGAVSMALGARFRDIGFRDGLVDEVRVFLRELSELEIASLYHAALESTTNSEVRQLDRVGITPSMHREHKWIHDSERIELATQLKEARKVEDDIITNVRAIMTMESAARPRQAFMLERGDYTMPGEEVSPATPESLFRVTDSRSNRLGLAEWLIDPNNPLVGRVIANRMWHHFFGRGIVASLEDFGSQGKPPTHPRLLDHLARSLIDDDWNLKNLCRRIVLSATYRQSSVPRLSTGFETDPGNELLARGPRHRLSAEQVRDTVLAASGLLVQKIGGPSVMPYQPGGVWKESSGKVYPQSKGEGLYRRSLYTFWKRTAPPPSMLTFDATSRESCTAQRELTTTPLQALVLLNDPQYVEAARVLAVKLIESHTKSHDRWDELFERLISRRPTPQEREVVGRLYDEQLANFRSDVEAAKAFLSVGDSQPPPDTLDSAEVAAVAVVVETLFSYDETQMKR